MKFVGYNGEMELDGATVKIKKGKKDAGHIIRISDILFVTLKKPGLMMAGCLHIQVVGAKTYSSAANAAHYSVDMNAVCFRKPQYDEAVMFKEAIERVISDTKA